MPARSSRRPKMWELHQLSVASVDHFRDYLQSLGFAANTTQQYLFTFRRFRSWFNRPRKRQLLVGEAAVAAFVRRCKMTGHLRQVHHIQSCLRHVLRMLRSRGELVDSPARPSSVLDVAMRDFARHLRETCGFAESTCRFHLFYVRQFLERKYGIGPLRLDRLCRDDFANFVTSFSQQWTVASMQRLASSLRTYLRYLQLQGICDRQLVASVPTIRQYRLSHLPRTMTEDQLHTFLSSFDRSTSQGRRNYAMALLMSSLGLRVSEVALLQLGDLNWRDGSIQIVSPKIRRMRILPLPVHVGQAIANYLRHGRPATGHRRVFARHVAPIQEPLTVAAVRMAMISAYRRCGFDPRWNGTHLLRHTVATHLHQRGATLKELADVLGHRSIESSAIYAKVNYPALTAVALPWPEVTP